MVKQGRVNTRRKPRGVDREKTRQERQQKEYGIWLSRSASVSLKLTFPLLRAGAARRDLSNGAQGKAGHKGQCKRSTHHGGEKEKEKKEKKRREEGKMT